MRAIILPSEVGSQIEPRLTAEGIRDLIRDLRDRKQRIPTYIIISEHDRRDLNQDVMSIAVNEVARDDQRPEHDGQCIAVIEGVMIGSNPLVPRGKARLVFGPLDITKRPGTGKIIIGA